MFGWNSKKYKPDIEKIKVLRKKYSRYLGEDAKTLVVYHKLYINSKLSRIKLVNIIDALEKKTNFLDRTGFEDYTGVYWTNKKAINTMFAKFNVDIVATDRYGNVIDTFQDVEPNSITKYHKDGWIIIMLPKGMLNVVTIRVGDHIKIWQRKKQYK